MKEYILFWKNYIKFDRSSTRKEYWIPWAINITIQLLLNLSTIFFPLLFGNALHIDIKSIEIFILIVNWIAYIFKWVLILPSWSIGVRRFRNAGIRWYWCLPFEMFITLISMFILLGNNNASVIVVIFRIYLMVMYCMATKSMKKNIFWN